jgi:BolA protein
MTRIERINALLTEKFSPERLEVVDDSAKHAGHAGASPLGETHYSVIISAQSLAGKSRVAQHQAIYAVLADELKNGLHALAITVK